MAGSVGMDPRPYSLHELYHMAKGRVMSIASGIAKAFGPNDKELEPQKLLKGHKVIDPGSFIDLLKAKEAAEANG